MSAIAASLIGTGIAAGASIGNTAFNASQTSRARGWSEKMYYQQLKDNLLISSPKYQVMRLREAGINPMLAYQGDQTVSPASAPSSPTASGALDASAFANIGLVKAQTELAEAQADKLREDTKGSALDNQAKEITNLLLPQINQATLENLKKDLDVKDVTISQANQAIAKMVSDIKLNDEQVKVLTKTVKKLELDNAFQEAVNQYKIPYYESGVDPDKNWQDMLVKALTSAFIAWKNNKGSALGSFWDTFTKLLGF